MRPAEVAVSMQNSGYRLLQKFATVHAHDSVQGLRGEPGYRLNAAWYACAAYLSQTRRASYKSRQPAFSLEDSSLSASAQTILR